MIMTMEVGKLLSWKEDGEIAVIVEVRDNDYCDIWWAFERMNGLHLSKSWSFGLIESSFNEVSA